MQIIPLELIDLQSDGYHLLVDVELFGQHFKMVVDTGASKTVLDNATLLDAGIAEADITKTNILSTGLGTNDMESFMVTIPEFRMAGWAVKNFEAAVLDLSSINYAYEQMELPRVIGVLGGDILYRYGAQIHYRKCSLTLRDRAVSAGAKALAKLK